MRADLCVRRFSIRGVCMLKKDLIKLCMLHLLTQSDRYGYEVLSLLHSAFPDTQESAIYALLRELCRDGSTERYTGSVSGGPARKYYRMTESGRKVYVELMEQWRSLRESLAGLGI